MSSSRIDEARPPAGAFAGVDHRSLVKRALPRSLFGRSLLIIVTPLILLQLISTWIFYERHWETVARRLSSSVAGDIGLVIETMSLMPSEQRQQFFMTTGGTTELDLSYAPGESLPSAPQSL